jgi:hypothetical protein
MTEHPRARLARLFNLRLAYDRRGLNRLQYLTQDMRPSIEGPWTIYGFPETTGGSPESARPE